MMSGGDGDMKPLVMSCLEDDPELHPKVTNISERLKKMKEVCSKKTGHDGMNPSLWVLSLSTQLQVCYCSYCSSLSMYSIYNLS